MKATTRRTGWPDEPLILVPELRFPLAAVGRLAEPRRQAERCGQITTLIGPAGAGKSHLARHGVRSALQKTPRLRWAWHSANEWFAQLQDAVAQQALGEFLTACGQLQVVVCEDLDQAWTDAAPELWLEWLDALRMHDARVLITLRQPPNELNGIPSRLLSRLRGGLTVRLGTWSEKSRTSFLKQSISRHDCPADEDVLAWLGQHGGTHAGDLVATAARYVTAVQQGQLMPRLDPVQQWWQQAEAPPLLSLAVIAKEVATTFQVPLEELRSSSRLQALRIPRQCAMFLAREEAGLSLAAIGQFFGSRTHTSVAHSCRRLQELILESPTLREQVQRLRDHLRKACG